MASICNDSNGRKRILFPLAGKRRVIRLGKASKKQAESVRVHIERLVSASITGQPLADETSRWIAGLDSTMTHRLANAGLVERTEQRTDRLLDFVDEYIAKRTDAKPSTATVWKRTRNHLQKFFGDIALQSVTTGTAKDFRRYLMSHELADATVRRTCGIAKQFFADAVDRQMIDRNPFKHRDIPTTTGGNKARFHFVDRELAGQVLDILPDAQWRLMFALARYGGLRCPSEVLSLRWQDIDWTAERINVRSPKTEHHDGGGSRVIPLFPELSPYLDECWQLASDGAEYVITRYRKFDSNYGVLLSKLVKQAGLECWPKPFQNLRSTRETELAESWPIHVVCDWIGNSEAVARKHYLQVTDEHFDKAAMNPTSVANSQADCLKAAQKAAQSVANLGKLEQTSTNTGMRKTPRKQGKTLNSRGLGAASRWALQDSNL